MNKPALFSFICRVVVGIIFLFAGVAKIADPVRFMLTLREFRLFPEAVIPLMVLYLPWLEFVLGLSLLLGVLYRASSLILIGLNSLFGAAILSVMVRGIEIDCGCFGLLADILKLPDAADIKAVVRDIVFVGMCVYIYRVKHTMLSLENHLRKGYEPASGG